MRILILTNRQGNQVALANKIGEISKIVGIICSENIPRKKPSLPKKIRLLLNGVGNRTAGREFVRAWFGMLEKYGQMYRDFPETDITNVKNVNDKQTIEKIHELSPDLVVVSGTNLLGRKLIESAGSRGARIINLHTGISPYVKGGPNCTNWCLAENWLHLIGNTVMWIDPGIDTGNIIATERTPLDGGESLFELHWKVMEHAHELYVSVIKEISKKGRIRSIPQKEIAPGTTFLSVDWTPFKMRRALLNFHHHYRDFFSKPEMLRQSYPEFQIFPLLRDD